MAAIQPNLKKQMGTDNTYVVGLAHDGGKSLACSTSANDVSILDIITNKVVNKHCLETGIVGIHFVNHVLYFLDTKLGVHQVDRRAANIPACKPLSIPLSYDDGDGVTACAFNESYVAFATRCTVETSGDNGAASNSDDDDDEEAAKNPIWVFDMRNMEKVLVETDAHSDAVSSLAFKDNLLISGGADGLVNVIDPSAAEEDYVLATVPIDSAVDRVGVHSIRNVDMLYATTDDYRWNLLKMNSSEDIDNVLNRRVRKERRLVDMVSLPREDFPVATVEYSIDEARMHLIGSSLDGTKSSIIGEYDFHKELPRVAKFVDGNLFTGGEDGFVASFPVELRDANGKTCRKFGNPIVRHLRNKKSLCMKAFIVFLAILLHGLPGVAIACGVGLKGPNCDEQCTMQCNTGVCDWRNGTEVCVCDENKWTGPKCEQALSGCATAKCNHGKCKPDNNTLTSFICICDDGYKGALCDEPIKDLCLGQSSLSCENDATCEDSRCICKDGFGGERCENVVPLLSEYEESQCNPACASTFSNKRCNEECNTAECFYDGLDCYEQPDLENSTLWFDVGASSIYCLRSYGNDRCDEECNSSLYAFDGGDCNKELRGTVKSKIQISLGVNPVVINLSKKFLLAYLAQLLRAGVSISKSDEDSLPEVFAIVEGTGIEERITLDYSLTNRYTNFTRLILDVDASFCHDASCLRLNSAQRTVQPAITLLRTVFVLSEQLLTFPSWSREEHFRVTDVSALVSDPFPTWFEIFLAVVIPMLVVFLLVASVLACCLVRRRRRCSKTSRDGGGCNRFVDHRKDRLVAAVEEGNVSSLTSLLSEITPIEAANAEDVSGNTVLHMAAVRDNKEVVRLLLHSRMFDVCSVNSIGQSPLVYALREGKPSLETLALLVNAISDTKLRQRTASQNSRAATANHLMLTALSEEPGWGLTDAVGRSALHHAALAGRPRHIIHFLVSHGASPGLPDSSGNTPLHLAAMNGHTETVHALLDERANVTVTNSPGNTPAQVCSLAGHEDLAAMLAEKEHAVMTAPMRTRHDSTRDTPYSESVYSDYPDELVLPSLLAFNVDMMPLLPPADMSSGDALDGGCDCGDLPLPFSPGLLSSNSLLSPRSGQELLSPTTTPTPRLPHILTPSAQLVEVSPERERPPSTLPRKCLYGVERSPSDPRPTQLTTPYSTICGKRRSLPEGPGLTRDNYRDVRLVAGTGHQSPVQFTYATNTMSTTSERSVATSVGHDSNVSSFRPPPLS